MYIKDEVASSPKTPTTTSSSDDDRTMSICCTSSGTASQLWISYSAVLSSFTLDEQALVWDESRAGIIVLAKEGCTATLARLVFAPSSTSRLSSDKIMYSTSANMCLSPDVLQVIFQFVISRADLLKCMLVCKSWKVC
jgi:hypothetical protein